VDKWKSNIQQTAESTSTDPVLLATIMQMESNGNPNAINHNNNGTTDYGIMQVNSDTAKEMGFDIHRLQTDPDYNMWAAAQEVKAKQATAKRIGLDPNDPFNIFWLYNGYSAQGKKYAQKAMDIYNSLQASNGAT
jgi:membrane-bound lytic murein transglycosylase MltF